MTVIDNNKYNTEKDNIIILPDYITLGNITIHTLNI